MILQQNYRGDPLYYYSGLKIYENLSQIGPFEH